MATLAAMTVRCSGCDALMFWAVSEKSGARMPIDAVPTSDGNITLDFGTDPPTAHVMTKRQIVNLTQGSLLDPTPERFTSHFATCPRAELFRRCGKCHHTPCVCAA